MTLIEHFGQNIPWRAYVFQRLFYLKITLTVYNIVRVLKPPSSLVLVLPTSSTAGLRASQNCLDFHVVHFWLDIDVIT